MTGRKFFNQTDSNLSIAISLSRLLQEEIGKCQRISEKEEVGGRESVLWEVRIYMSACFKLNEYMLCGN